MNAQQYKDELDEVNGITVSITTYKIGDYYYCHIANLDPGATIARASGSTVAEARQNAMEKLMKRVKPVK